MQLTVTFNQSNVSFQTHTDYSDEERKLFLDSLAPWLRKRVYSALSLFYADIPIAVVNDHLPYGKSPCRFIWDILVDAHHRVVCPPTAY